MKGKQLTRIADCNDCRCEAPVKSFQFRSSLDTVMGMGMFDRELTVIAWLTTNFLGIGMFDRELTVMA